MTKLKKIMDLLRENYGVPERQERGSPVESLIQVILSQNTNDKNRDRAWKKLKERYGDPKQIMEADVDEISDAISVAGLHNTKAERIKESLEKIREERGELKLDFLGEMELEEARNWLMELPGVGPKSAAVVLNFSFGKPTFPVDTHVLRVSKRLGLIPEDTTRERAHRLLEDKVTEERTFEFHINLIKHGRETCKAPVPVCSECFLQEVCDYYSREGEPKN
ncbi:MAG: endonuclease III [Candidatus Aenigmatarchaeota archaeon]